MSIQVNVNTWSELASAIQNASSEEVIEILVTSPLTKTSSDKAITISENQNIIIKPADESDLVITRRYSSSIGEFIVSNNAVLTLMGNIIVSGGNSSVEKNNYLTGANFVLVEEGGSLVINANITIQTAMVITTGLFSFIHCFGKLEIANNSTIKDWTIKVNNKRISGVTNYSGAAIKLEGENAVGIITNSTISNCINPYPAKVLSSSIQVIKGAKLYLTEVNINNCGSNLGASSQGIMGGALYLTDNSYTKISKCDINNNKAVEGGGIYIDTNAIVKLEDETQFTNNLACSGGALYIKGTVKANNVTISSNRNNNQYGSAIYLKNASANLTADNISVSDNLIDNNSNFGGGAIYSDSGNISISNSVISGNRPIGGTLIEFNYGYKVGGGFNLKNGSCSLVNTDINNNWAMVGAGIYSNNCQLEIDNCNFNSNESTKGDKDNKYSFLGGAIYAAGNTVKISDSKIYNNTSLYLAGGIFISSASFVCDNVSFENNNATGGGGLFLSDSIFNCENVVFDSNKATFNDLYEEDVEYFNGIGGAIINLGKLYISGGRFVNNNADRFGKGIYQNNVMYLKGEPYFDASSDVYLPASTNTRDLENSDKVIIKSGELNLPNPLTVTPENPISKRVIMASDEQYLQVLPNDLNDLNVITNNERLVARYIGSELDENSQIIIDEIGKIRVSHSDAITGQIINEDSFFNQFLNENYEVYPNQIENYYNSGDSGNSKGVLTKDVSVEFYYSPITPKGFVEVNYYLYGSKNKIKTSDFLEGNFSEPYNVLIVPINGYYYNYSNGNLNGLFTIDDQIVDLYYTKFEPRGTVLVNYIDKDTGLEIHGPEILEGAIGSSYSVTVLPISNYYFSYSEGELTGIFQKNMQTIKLFYDKTILTITSIFLDLEQNAKLLENQVIQGHPGEKYEIKIPAISNYDYKYSSDKIIGTFPNENKSINHFYSSKIGYIEVRYLDYYSGKNILNSTNKQGVIGNQICVYPKEICGYYLCDNTTSKLLTFQKTKTIWVFYYRYCMCR